MRQVFAPSGFQHAFLLPETKCARAVAVGFGIRQLAPTPRKAPPSRNGRLCRGGRAAPPTGGGVIDQGRCSDVSTHPSPACSLLLCRRERSGFSSLVKVGYQRWPREIRKCCQSQELAVEVQSNVHIVLHSCDAIEVGLLEMH